MTYKPLDQRLREKGKEVPPKPSQGQILDSWLKVFKMKIGGVDKTINGMTIGNEITIMKCRQCKKDGICQHQGFCLECMADNAWSDEMIHILHEGECGMCGKQLKLNEQNPCAECCNMAMGDTDEDRIENMESVIEHCKDVTRKRNE